jgi:hypothetical protein
MRFRTHHVNRLTVMPYNSSNLKQFFDQGLAHGIASDVRGWDTSG